MFTSLLEKPLSLFDRRFIFAYWLPVFNGELAFLVGLAFVAPRVLFAILDLFTSWLDVLTLMVLIGFLGGYALQISMPVWLAIYKGNWPRWLRLPGIQYHYRRWERLNADRQAPATADYPTDPARLQPTTLGNITQAVTEYPYLRYGMNALFWWPRLQALLPQTLQKQIERQGMYLLALLNTTTLALFTALLSSSLYFLLGANARLSPHRQPWQLTSYRTGLNSLLIPSRLFQPIASHGTTIHFSTAGYIILLLLIAWLAYGLAVVQARAYGAALRTAYDYHRLDIFAALHLPLPENPSAEAQQWQTLEQWLTGPAPESNTAFRYNHSE